MKKAVFFSYKGGSGRSSTLANVVPFLFEGESKPSKEHPVILVDMDLDSTGLTILCGKSKEVESNPNAFTVSDVLEEGFSYDQQGLLMPVGKVFGQEPESVLLLPARPGDYKGRDNSSKSVGANAASHLKSFTKIWEKYGGYAIIFDSSSGDQETATQSVLNSNLIVCCMRPTTQFLEGTVSYFKRLSSQCPSINVLIVPTAVPQQEYVLDGRTYPQQAKATILNRFQAEFEDDESLYFDYGAIRRSSGVSFGVPLVRRFQWEECILKATQSDSKNQDEIDAMGTYRYIAEKIKDLGEE
ncbi:MAG: hypothetical protein K6E59_05075 [Bacilli bacterium]|nr:hypothetical protein [Bacilli bacterium]